MLILTHLLRTQIIFVEFYFVVYFVSANSTLSTCVTCCYVQQDRQHFNAATSSGVSGGNSGGKPGGFTGAAIHVALRAANSNCQFQFNSTTSGCSAASLASPATDIATTVCAAAAPLATATNCRI